MYTPDNFVILKVVGPYGEVFYKVLAGWSGGYLDGDSWRMNSGITSFTLENDYYKFVGYTGSLYKCHKDSEVLRMNISGVLTALLERYPKNISLSKVEDIELGAETDSSSNKK